MLCLGPLRAFCYLAVVGAPFTAFGQCQCAYGFLPVNVYEYGFLPVNMPKAPPAAPTGAPTGAKPPRSYKDAVVPLPAATSGSAQAARAAEAEQQQQQQLPAFYFNADPRRAVLLEAFPQQVKYHVPVLRSFIEDMNKGVLPPPRHAKKEDKERYNSRSFIVTCRVGIYRFASSPIVY